MQNQSSKQAKAIPGIEKQKPPSKSKQASKQERSKNMQNTSKGKPPPLQVLPTQTPGKNQSIHPHTSRTLFEKKNSQISSPSPN
jgi:hypothetical protein